MDPLVQVVHLRIQECEPALLHIATSCTTSIQSLDISGCTSFRWEEVQRLLPKSYWLFVLTLLNRMLNFVCLDEKRLLHTQGENIGDCAPAATPPQIVGPLQLRHQAQHHRA